jgi:hypothetical protein
MKNPHDDAAKWEDLARREPYFALRVDDDDTGVQSSSIETDAFFKTGEDDIAALFAA